MLKEENKKTAVMISNDLYDQLKEIIRESGFSSVDDYVNYILQSQVGRKKEKDQDLSEEDTAAVTSRLKALGYI
jgi:Arc/MetJ-type ribon-helix-helix transcriptional regulator